MSGTVTYEVAPIEKLQKDFQEIAKNQIYKEISMLDSEQKKILKFIETIGKGTNLTEIMEKCLFINATSGGSRSRISDKISNMIAFELLKKDAGGRIYPNLKAKIAKLLEIHNATSQEQEAVYSHILMEMVKEA
jgi:hypothetical protein